MHRNETHHGNAEMNSRSNGKMKPKWIVLLLALSASLFQIIIAAYHPAISRTSRGEPAPRLMQENGSAISVVACSLTSARTSSLRNAQVIENIIKTLPSTSQVLLLVNDPASFKTNHSARVTFVELPETSRISIWPQDPFLVLRSNGESTLLVPRIFERGDDSKMPEQLAAKLDLTLLRSNLIFEGGNIVCGDQMAIIGNDTILQNVREGENDREKVIRDFEKQLGLDVVVVGQGVQSVGHIDLIVTPIGGNRVVVADTFWGAELMMTAIHEHPSQLTKFESQCEQQFFGDANIESLTDASGERINRPTMIGGAYHALRNSFLLAKELNLIADQLREQGFEVTRMPALIPEMRTSELNYPVLTYNNVLLETRNSQSIVYLPQYGLPTLDTACAAEWKRLGFSIKAVQGLSTSAIYGGSLRCCTKVLHRD